MNTEFSAFENAFVVGSPVISTVKAAPETVDNYITRHNYDHRNSVNYETLICRPVRGQRCRTKAELLDHWSAALQFPDYFGRNWDAFQDMLGDLGWIPATGYAIFVTSAERILEEEPTEILTLLSILERAARAHANPDPAFERPARLFRVILQFKRGSLLVDDFPFSDLHQLC